jgi:hypothetical protein
MTRDEALEDAFDARHETGTVGRLNRALDREADERCRTCKLWVHRLTGGPMPRLCECWLVETKAEQSCDHHEPLPHPGSVLGEK